MRAQRLLQRAACRTLMIRKNDVQRPFPGRMIPERLKQLDGGRPGFRVDAPFPRACLDLNVVAVEPWPHRALRAQPTGMIPKPPLQHTRQGDKPPPPPRNPPVPAA